MKRTLSILLTLCMLLSLVPITATTASADTDFTQGWTAITGTTTITSDGNYYLNSNVTGNITVNSGVSATLDLNGYVLNGTGSGAVITNNGGTLTVTDSSTAKPKHYFTEGNNMLWNWNGDSAVTDFYTEGGTITGGNETANGGGGVCSINGTTTISNVNIVGNQTSKWGGGVRGKGSGSIALTDTNILHNFATSSSGGISLDGTPLTINGGSVSYNKSVDGGGIYPYNATSFSATNCLIKGNVSTGKGGGIYIATTTSTLTGCEFDGNSASNYAGAVRLDGSNTATFDGCNFHDNTSGSQGGAIKSDNATVIIKNSTVKNNTAKGTGGGMQIWNGSLTLDGTTVTDNTATDNGGGVYANCNVTLSGNTVVTDNNYNDTQNNLFLNTNKLITLTNAGSKTKVGVKLAGATGKFTSNVTSDDVKYFTSDIITSAPKYNTNGYLEIVNINVCYVSDSTSEANNYATISAALEQSPDKIVLKKNVTENVTISSGTTVALDLNGYVLKGTGTPITNNDTLTLTSSDTTTLHYFTYVNHGKWVYIPEPTTAQINGAIPFADMDGKALVSDSTVISIPGGIVTGGTNRGIVNTGSSATLNMSDVSIVGNNNQWGGGLDNQSGAKAYITDVNVIGNIATKWGGAGVNNDSSTLSYEGGCIAYNSLTGCGDNIKCSGLQTNVNATLTNVKVIHNYSVKNGGGVGTIGNNPVLTLNSCTITDNEAVQYGGGVYIGYGSLSVSGNTVITENKLGSATQNLYLASGKTITIGTNGLGGNAEIGVTLQSSTGKFTSNGEASDKQYFTSDNSSYAVKYNTSGYFDLVSGYTVTEATCTNGSVSVGTTKIYAAGETVTVTPTADSDYVIDKVYYGETEITPVEGVYSFTMPASDVTVSATFKSTLMPVSYIAPVYNTANTPTSGLKGITTESCDTYTLVTNFDTSWGTTGETTWYVVTGTVTINNSVKVFGNVHLILEDECALTVDIDKTNTSGDAAIQVQGENSMTVYAQSNSNNMGSLTAKGDSSNSAPYYVHGAGIGGESYCDGNNIFINGGKITAIGGDNASGIGGGGGMQWDACNGKNIVINGGIVYASSSRHGTGIGAGYNGNGEDIVINGGEVHADCPSFGAGIGGNNCGDGKNITINGGTVTAVSASGAGIGGGDCGNGNNITINGGTVTAASESGAGIGGGECGSGSDITITGGTVSATGGSGADGIGNGYNCTTAASNIKIATTLITKADGNNPPTTVIKNNGSDLASSLAGKRYATIKLPEVSYIAPVYNTANTPTSGLKSTTTESCTDYTLVTDSDSAWGTAGETTWYVVDGTISMSNQVIVKGTVNLILKDGCNLTVTGSGNYKAGIDVSGDGNALNIYAQSTGADMGKLTATGTFQAAGIGSNKYANGGNITINGGNVTANGSYGAGIGGGFGKSGSNIIINGGIVAANGGANGAGIGGASTGSGSDITINSGIVAAIGGDYSPGIGGGGSKGNGSNITINGGEVTAIAGNKYETAIGNGYNCTTAASNIKIATTLATKADGNNPPTTYVVNVGGDLASSLAGKQYATIVKGYTVTEATCTNGSVSVGEIKTYVANDTVTVTATPSSKNYVIDKVYYGETEITPVEGVYSFTMPESNVTVSATFKLANIAYNDFDSMAIGELPIGWDISGSDCQYEKYPGDMWQVYKDTNNRIALRVRNYNFSSGTYADINTPTLTLSSTNAEKLVFNYAHQSNSKPLEVWISDDGGVNFTKLAGFGYNSESGYNDTTATKLSNAIVNLTDYKGKSVIIKLRMVSTYGDGSIFVDDFDIVPITEDDKKLLSVTTPSVANAVYSLSYTTANAQIATFPTSTAVTTGDGVSSMPVVWALKDGTTYTTADSEVNTFTWSLVYDGYDANGQTVTGEIAVKNVAYNDFDSMPLKKTPLGWSTAESNPANPSAENCWGVYQNGDRIMLRMNNFMLRKGTAIIDTPAITLEDGIRYLTFKYCHQANNGSFEVQISDDGGETFTKLAEYSNPFTYYDNTNPASLTRTTIDLVDYLEKTVIIRLYTTSNFGKGAIFIDDFDIVPSVAKIKETGVLYTSVQSAIDAATQGQTVMLIHDAAESVTVNSDDDIILDLNGYVLRSSGTESVINNNGVLSVKNTDLTPAIRYFTDKKCKHSVKVGTYCSACEANAKPDGCYETMSTEKPASGTDYITVSGGVITGGYGGTYVSYLGYCGGGICNAGTLTLTNVNIVGNRTSSGNGGGIFSNGTSLEMNGGVISGNASASNGGGIYIHSGVNNIKGVDISDNTSSDNGGGICNTAGDLSITIEDCSICDNTVTDDYGEGGGIRFNGGSLLVKNTEINGNSADFSGGALINAGTVTFDGVTVTANTSSRDGGCFHSSGAITLEGKINITGNTSNGTVCNYDGNEKEIIIGSTFDTASTIGVYCYDIPFTVTSACAKDVHECFSSDIDAYMTVDRGIEGTDNHEVVVTGRITKHPTIDNNYTLTVNTDRLTNNTVKYQWKMRTSMKWSGLTENEDFEMVCGSVSGDYIESGDYEAQAVVIKFIGLPVGTKVVFSSDAEVYKTQRSDGKYEGELDEDGYIWIWGKDDTKPFTIKIEEIPFYEVVAGETAAQLAKPKLSETYICTATFADGSVLASNEVIVPVCRITQSTDTTLEGKYYTSIADALKAAGTNETTILLCGDYAESISIGENQVITLDLNGYVLAYNKESKANGTIYNEGTLTVTDSDTEAQTHKVRYFTDEICAHSVKVGTYCEDCEANATADGCYETYTTVKPDDMTNVLTVTGGAIVDTPNYGINNLGTFTLDSGNIVGNICGIQNSKNGVITMNGGSILGSSENGVYNDSGTFTMNDGVIAYNNGYECGGVSNSGTFIMNDGSIVNNNGYFAGGIDNYGNAQINGGTISDNTGFCSGGVFTADTFTVGGSAVITGNTGSMINNVATVKDMSNLTIGTSTDKTDGNGVLKPTDKMNIGVGRLNSLGFDPQTGDLLFEIVGGQFTDNGASTDTKYFTSDSDSYVVKYNSEGHLELGMLFTVTEASCTNGSVSVGTTKKYTAGETVTVTVTPDAGYVLDTLTYTPDGGTAVDIKSAKSFTMPASNVTVNATFRVANYVCYIDANANGKFDTNEVKYESIAEALAADYTGEDGDNPTVIVLIKDDAESITIPKGRYITLDLNGYVIIASMSSNIVNNGSLTIIDSGKDKVHYFVDEAKFSNNNFVSGKDGCFEKFYTGTGVPNGTDGEDYIKVSGGCITGAVAQDGSVVNTNTGTLTLKDGNIIGNVAASTGGGIFNSGIFNMEGGHITNNWALIGGAGIYNAGTFNMTGGTIENNLAESTICGGVYNESDCTVKLGGTAKITGNKANDVDSNLVLSAPIEIGTGTDGNNIAEPAWTTPIGVIVLNDDYQATYGKFTDNGASTDTKYFTSDNPEYGVKYNSEGYLELVKIPEIVKGSKNYVSLTLADSIAINFRADNFGEGYDYTKLIVNVDGTEYTVDENSKCILANASASEMGKEITVKLIYDGVEYKTFTYSVAKYCKSVLASSTSAQKLKDICKATLNYGAYAQLAFGKDTDNLVNAGNEWATGLIDTKVNPPEQSLKGNTVITNAKASLTLGSAIALNITFDSTATLTADDIVVTNDLGQVVLDSTLDKAYGYTFTDNGGGNYSLTINNISASRLSRSYTVKVKGAELTYSALNYCADVQGLAESTEITPALKTLCRAIALYAGYAQAYFAK